MKPETKKRPPILRVLKGILLFLLIAVLLAAAAVFVLPLCEGVSRAPVEGSADWMAALDDSTPLNLVTLPGTHNAGAANAQLAFFSKCQSLGIRAQLEAGYRYLDIRLGKDEADGELILKHGFTNCKPSALSSRALTLAEAAADCCAFLDAHPTEAVLFCVKHEHGDFPISEMQTLLAAECAKAPERWFLSDTLPTVGEARGKIVLLRRYGDDAGLGEAAVHFLSTKGSLAYGHPFWFARTLNRRLLRYGLPVGEPLGWIIVDFGSAKLAEHVWRCNFS